MAKKQIHEKANHAEENGRGWYKEILRMNADFKKAEESDNEEERERVTTEIEESPLEVAVDKGERFDGTRHYMILLSTGGPALRIEGELDEYDEPMHAYLQYQDWGTPWTRVPDVNEDELLDFSRHFYFAQE